MNRLKMRASAGIVMAAAVMTAATTAWADPSNTLKLSIGVRETGTAVAIGGNGGFANGIEWINKDGQTLTADGTWQHFTFNFGTDPVVGFAGGTADGTLSSPNMMGTLENIRILNSTPTTSEISLYLDDITFTLNNSGSASGNAPGTYTLADFEGQAPGDIYMFNHPLYSGSTSGFLASDPDTAEVVDNTSTDAHGGNNSLFVNFKFSSPSTSAWDRLTTFQAPGAPNPAIDFTSGNVLSFWAKVSIAAPTMFWNADADGDWWDQNNWSSATDPIPGQFSDPLTAAGTDTARFLSAITADHTVTLSQDTFLNQLILDNAHSYTIQSSPGGPKLYMTAANTTAGAASISASNGTQNVNADIQLNASLNLSAAGTATLNIGNTIDLADVITLFADNVNPQITVTKDGTGTANIHDLLYGYLRVSEGTLTVAPGSALHLVTNAKGAGAMPAVASTPQALYVGTNGTLNLTNTSPTLTYRWTNTDDNTTTDATATVYNDGTINMSGGTLDTNRITIVSTRGNLNLSNGAAVHANRYVYGANISLTDSSVTITSNGGSVPASNIDDLTITGNSYYDVNDNDMIINTGNSSPEQIAKIRGYLVSGRNGGSWDGVGIRSAAAGADANHLTALGYATSDDMFGAAGGTFSGWGVASGALLIKYTWYGDANLDGKITADDYALIDRGAALGVASWINGDFNYDGSIDSADYLLLDTSSISTGGTTLSPAFLAMREAQFGSAYVSSLIAAVPEPTTLSLLALAGLGALGRRRRASQASQTA